MRLSSLTFFCFGLLVTGGCGSSPPPAPVVAKHADPPKKQPDSPKGAVCNDQVDVADLFARHAAAFGTEAAVAQALPITISGTVTVSGKPGTFEASVDAKHVRNAIHVKGFERANGTDDSGAWQLGNSGAVSRLREGEASTTDEWIFRRHYLSSFDPKRDVAVCHLDNGKREIIVHEKIDTVGSPRFVFDQDSAQLIGAEFTGVDGRSSTRTFTWDANATALPKWPTQSSEQDGDGSTIEKTRETLVAAAANAFALPASTIDIAWPKSGAVRVPMKLYGGEIFLDVTVGGKKARALLDSGAGISIVDASGKAADAFTSELEFGGGPDAAQQLHFGIGKLSELHIGALTLKNVPAARVPIPAVETFGPNRPDVVIGWSLFEGNAVRIDYARNELVFSRDSSVHAADALSIDFHVWDDRIVAPAKLGAQNAAFLQLDTGNAFTISLYRGWAKKNHIPNPSEQVVSMLGISGGPDQAPSIYFRNAFSIGPVVATNDFVEVGESRDDGRVAGLMGNLTFAKCSAVVFDAPSRKLWLEGKCDRTPAQSHSWWTLARDPGAAANAENPWVVVSTAAQGSADAAGIVARDRVIAIDGKPAGTAFDFISAFSKPLGTKVTVTILRGTETKKVSLTLKDPF